MNVLVLMWQPRNSTLLPVMTAKRSVRKETGLTEDGYPVNYGSSFIMAVSYEADGPHADAILTYSQSTDARSPHASDQTARYATPIRGDRCCSRARRSTPTQRCACKSSRRRSYPEASTRERGRTYVAYGPRSVAVSARASR